MAKQSSKTPVLQGLDAETLSSAISHHPPNNGGDDAARHSNEETDHRGHSEHMLRSVRTAHHAGHDIEIVTTYEITIDGRKVNVHARVERDGSLRCHSMPYTSHPSAVDLVKALIDGYPQAAQAVANPRRRRSLKLEPLPELIAPKKREYNTGAKK